MLLQKTALKSTGLDLRSFVASCPRSRRPAWLRDHSPFAESQRVCWSSSLLLGGRLRLGVSGRSLDGVPVLITHAGFSMAVRMASLGVGEAVASTIALQLNRALDRAVIDVAPSWRKREPAALSLAPLHLAGGYGVEGGGLLYHRPSDTSRAGADRTWELRPAAPRRFHPRELPRGLFQVCGHCNHEKCLTELDTWASEDARTMKAGRLRTLSVTVDQIVSRGSLLPHSASASTLVLIDFRNDLFDYPCC
ncbi:MAG: hypothetical protein U0165_09220 [Polyangiaceae bacterium]